MRECNRDFIERAASITGRLYGEPMSPNRIAENFALYGLKRRAAALEHLDDEMRGEIDSSPNNLRRRVQLMELRRKIAFATRWKTIATRVVTCKCNIRHR